MDKKDKSYEKTPEEIQLIEAICIERAELRQKNRSEYETKINTLLADQKLEELSVLLESSLVREIFDTDTEMAYMMLSNQIYLEECRQGVKRRIWDGRYCISEIMELIQKLKFQLWHVEFMTEEAAGEQLMEFVEQEQISLELLKYMIHTAGMNKPVLAGAVGTAFLEAGQSAAAFSLLKYADELEPDVEEILCTLAGMCLEIGRKEEALECLNRVNQPTELTQMLRKLCGV